VRALMQRFSYVGSYKVGTRDTDAPGFGVAYPPCVAGLPVNRAASYSNIYPRTAMGEIPIVTPDMLPTPWTWVSHYASMYVGLRGGHRVKVCADSGGVITPVYATPIFNVFAMDSPTASFIQNYAQQRDFLTLLVTKTYGQVAPFVSGYAAEGGTSFAPGGIEVYVPFYSTQTYLFPRPGQAIFSDLQGLNQPVSSRTNASAFFSLGSTPLTSNAYVTTGNVYVAAGPDVGISRFRRTPGVIWTPPV